MDASGIDAKAPTTEAAEALPAPRYPLRLGLAARLAVVASIAVLATGLLVQLAALGELRGAWLDQRIAAARGIVAMLEDAGDPNIRINPQRLLEGAGLRAIVLQGAATRRQFVSEPIFVDAPAHVDLRQVNWFDHVGAAAALLAAPSPTPILVLDAGPTGYDTIEVLVGEAGLRDGLALRAMRIFIASSVLALAAGAMFYVLLRHAVARPLRRLAAEIGAFARAPECMDGIIAPSHRSDEIDAVERAIAQMQIALGGQLRHRHRLAALGLSVSKIIHELRNQLATAQLLVERLESAPEPSMRQATHRLAATIDRAIRFCESTLAYGRAAERPTIRTLAPIGPVLADLRDLAGLTRGSRVSVAVSATPDLIVDADCEQLARALCNLVRNAVQALDSASPSISAPEVRITAHRKGMPGNGEVTILVEDNGPGLSIKPGDNPFAPFQGSTRADGSGLGLAIAAELVALNGGRLSLDGSAVGACFRIVIPDRRTGKGSFRRRERQTRDADADVA